MLGLIGLIKPLLGFMTLAVTMGVIGHLCASFITIFGGSGKFTLLKLLIRFWNVNGGEIKISGVNVNEINTENLRENEGFVTLDSGSFVRR